MPFDLHCVVQDTTDADQVGAGKAIEQQMTGTDHEAVLDPRAFPAVAQVIAAHVFAKLGPGDAVDPLRLGRHVPKGRHQQAFIAEAGDLPEVLIRPGK